MVIYKVLRIDRNIFRVSHKKMGLKCLLSYQVLAEEWSSVWWCLTEYTYPPMPPRRDLLPVKQGGAGRTARQVLPAEQKTGELHLGGYFNRGLQECTLYNIQRWPGRSPEDTSTGTTATGREVARWNGVCQTKSMAAALLMPAGKETLKEIQWEKGTNKGFSSC